LDVLIRVKAFQFTGINKRELLWDGYYKLNHQPKTIFQEPLFKVKAQQFEFPKLPTSALEEAFDQIELLGLSLINPFMLLKEELAVHLQVSDMPKNVGKRITLYGYLITTKTTSTTNKKRINFGTFIDRSGNWIDTVHFPPVVARYPFRGKGIYQLTGLVVDEFGFLSIEVSEMHRLAYVEDVRFAV